MVRTTEGGDDARLANRGSEHRSQGSVVGLKIGRKLSVADVMILVAATAVGLALTRAYFGEYFQARPIREHQWLRWAIVAGSLQSIYYLPILASWSVALVVLRLRPPRPRLRRLAWRPGWVATCAAATALTIGWLMVTIQHYTGHRGWHLVESSVHPVGVAVTAAWVNLAACGRWRPEAEWIDRLGRVVGVCWIVITLLLTSLFLPD
jgi:hypothetical protein